jgi:hypothetical protein
MVKSAEVHMISNGKGALQRRCGEVSTTQIIHSRAGF